MPSFQDQREMMYPLVPYLSSDTCTSLSLVGPLPNLPTIEGPSLATCFRWKLEGKLKDWELSSNGIQQGDNFKLAVNSIALHSPAEFILSHVFFTVREKSR